MAQGNFLKLTKTTEARSPERAALATAIERHRAAVAFVAANERARDLAWEQKFTAQARVVAANAAVEDAKAAAATYLTNAAAGAEEPAPLSIRQAVADAQNAAAEFSAIVAIRETLEEQKAEGEKELGWADFHLKARVREVMAIEPAVLALVAEYQATKLKLFNMRATIRMLDGKSMLPAHMRSWDTDPSWREVTGLTGWGDAIAALGDDADARLPKVEN